MRKIRALAGLAAGCLLVWGSVIPALAAPPPSVAQVLAYEPKQKGVVCSTPSADEHRTCTVEPVKGKQGAVLGWLLVDSKKQPLRRFWDSNGDGKIDTWSYFRDGVESYRESDSNRNERPDQYRWINAGGMKWGVDVNEDGTIDSWRTISAEEVAEEIFFAVAERNAARLRALFLTEPELRTLRLPAERADKIRKTLQGALAKFEKTVKEAHGIDQAHFVRVESGVPQCVPAEEFGGEQDLIHFTTRPILYEIVDRKGEKKHDWLHTGEMVQVGLNWRLIDAPTTQPDVFAGTFHSSDPKAPAASHSAQLQKLLEILSNLDKNAPVVAPGVVSKPVQDYNVQRVQVIQQILVQPEIKGEERETWIKQICDNLCSAVMGGHQTALGQLGQYRDQLIKSGNENLAAYAAYRYLWATYQPQLQNPKNHDSLKKIQDDWLEKLAQFVRAYPKSEDAPEAGIQLGMGSEFSGRDEEAKRWYAQLAENFPNHPLAAKAKGAVERLGLVGQELKLSGPMLQSRNPFDIARLRGKVVVVYYWASYCQSCIGDFARLNQIKSTYGSKGLELVLVNLDDREEDALKFLQKNTISATHLFQTPSNNNSGLQSPFALQYGIMGLPNLFLVGRDGKVLNRTLQVNDLEDALRRAL